MAYKSVHITKLCVSLKTIFTGAYQLFVNLYRRDSYYIFLSRPRNLVLQRSDHILIRNNVLRNEVTLYR